MITNENITSPSCVALGFFDGVHLGHASLIKKAKEAAGNTLKSVIYTLDTHPSVFFGSSTPMITPGEIRINLLESFETDYIYIQKTDRDFLNISPEDFVSEILIKKLNAKHIVSGENYTFGKNKSGTSDLLKRLCSENSIQYTVVPYSLLDETIISSSAVRLLLESGDVERAADMLGRPFFISGQVIHCRNVGHTLGFPTANIILQKDSELPLAGVYATNTVVDDKTFPSITNVGFAPTFDVNKTVIESHILNFDEDIYSKKITVEFLQLIRKQKKFDSSDELICQLKKDTETRRKI